MGILLQCFDQTAPLIISTIKEGCLHYGVYFMMSYMYLSSCIHCFHEYEITRGRIKLLKTIDNTNDHHKLNEGKGGCSHVAHKILGCVPFFELVDISSVL